MAELMSIVMVLISSIVGALGAIMLKLASNKFGFSLSGTILNKALIGGIVLYGLSTLIFVPALRGGELSVLYPIASTLYIWTALFSAVILSEKMNKYKWIAILLIVLGVSLVGLT